MEWHFVWYSAYANDNFDTPAFGDGYWVMYDYNRGYYDDHETSGLMDIFRIPKFSYYFFKSQQPQSDKSVLQIASYWNQNSDTNATVFDYSAYCQNVCNVTDISICSTFNQSEDVYHGLLITLWVLLVLSTLEGILERFLDIMPHCKFLEPIQREDQDAPDGSEEGVELQQRDIPPEV